MTKRSETIQKVQTLQDQVRLQLVEAANKAWDHTQPLLPGVGEQFTPITFAKLRWEMLKSGFSHSEIAVVTNKLKARLDAGTPVQSLTEWIRTIAVDALLPISDETSQFALYILEGGYKDRLAGKILNAHEKICYLTAKRIQELVEDESDDVRNAAFERIATECGINEEMIWRVATGGTRIPGSLLDKINRVLRRIDSVVTDE